MDPLGSGAFGRVLKGEADGIIKKGKPTTVAVKMVKRDADITYVKALMAEIKIMIHLGRHINVVNLLGACTRDLGTKRDLYMIVEYCRFGNLQKFIQTHRDVFVNQLDPATGEANCEVGKDIGRQWAVFDERPPAQFRSATTCENPLYDHQSSDGGGHRSRTNSHHHHHPESFQLLSR